MENSFTLRATPIVMLGDFPITNSVLAAFLITLIIISLVVFIKKGASLVPTRLQLGMEIITSFFLDSLRTAFGSEQRARKYLPLFLSIFIFLVIANQFSVIPLVTSIIASGGNLLRVPTSDWSQTITLALIVVVGAHLIALSISPLRHIGNFIKIKSFFKVRSFSDFGNAFLEFFLGLMDIISEFAKVISISARLFGNIFAGEIMVAIIASIAVFTQFIVPVPFMILSIFSGFVQAFVFTLLSLQFMTATITSVKRD